MNYLGKRINSISSGAINGLDRLRARAPHRAQDANQHTTGQATLGRPDRPKSPRELLRELREGTHRTQLTRPFRDEPQVPGPFQEGFLFGGDSRQSAYAPPPIGFRTDLIMSKQDTQAPEQQQLHTVVVANRDPEALRNQSQAAPAESSESLYQADFMSRQWFLLNMVGNLTRLFAFIAKIYQDFHATRFYSNSQMLGYFLLSLLALFLPTIMFTIYRVARYLQISLPSVRTKRALERQLLEETRPQESKRRGSLAASKDPKSPSADDDDRQLKRALMSSPTSGHSSPAPSTGVQQPTASAPTDDGGLVTARQSPDEFHDSSSHQASTVDISRTDQRLACCLVEAAEPKLESTDVNKLGNLPDREGIRLCLGVSEQLLQGALFIFWQTKRQVDVLAYMVDRACVCRKPKRQEKSELERLSIGRDGLDWFQNFYAAFLALLLQMYVLSLNLHSDKEPLRNPLLSYLASTSGGSGPLPAAAGGDGSSVSSPDQTLSSALQALSKQADSSLSSRDAIILSQLVISSMVVVSLLVAVRRRDDGPLSLALSMLGWGSLFAARILVISLAFVHIHWKIMVGLMGFHVLAIGLWVYKIALDSHNDKPSERADEAKWDVEEGPAEAVELQQQKQADKQQTVGEAPQQQQQPASNWLTTSRWGLAEHLSLLAQVFVLFAIPSLFYWPIMFNLKLNFRPLKYLALILVQNALLITAVWFETGSKSSGAGQLYLLAAVGTFSIVGFVFVSLYYACKPSLTEYFARADELFNEAERSGIYYEFCSRVFKMPDLSKHSFRRLMNQYEVEQDEQEELQAEPELRDAGGLGQQAGDQADHQELARTATDGS